MKNACVLWLLHCLVSLASVLPESGIAPLSSSALCFLTHHVLEFYPRRLCHRTSFFTCCSVAPSCPTLGDPVNCSAPGFSVHHSLPECAQTQVPWVSDASNHLIFCHPVSSCPQIFPAFQFINSYMIFNCKIHHELFTHSPVDGFCSSFKIFFAITN